MKKKVFLILIIVLSVQMTIIAADRLFLGTAVKFQGVVALNDKHSIRAENVLMYQDRTYVSLRDMAETFHYDVTWDEENRVASATRKSYTRSVVEKPETALVIAKATAKWRYAEDVSEHTKYILHTVKEDDGITTTYWIYVFFDGQRYDMRTAEEEQSYEKQYADVSIAVDSVLGFVGVEEK